ncbi:serine hydrolase [Anderseniella sp. Alg231-50]|uniref:serine hydrolase n=1 Tax=Anderseniella sp. Alg231-50 TaxID=1922226 RepID=UPI000D54E2F5
MGISLAGKFKSQTGFDKGRSVVMVLILSLVLIAGANRPAMARPAFSAVTVDASTGKIIYSKNLDAKRYPASLTKVMTLYLMFQEIDAGRMSFSTPMKVSKRAAAQQPSKLGLRVGSTITARNAMFALITKSANDAAMVVAEHIGGSQKGFAKRMTRQARALGMTRTKFTNPNGLPDKRQVTTARDMATLGLRIQRDFPKYYKHFATRSFKYGKRKYRNHNRLLGKLKGVDGIKTGYTRASGFNLLSSRTLGTRSLVAVVMGGRSGRSRNAFMTKILKRDLRKASRGSKKIAMVAGTPPGYSAAAAARASKINKAKSANPSDTDSRFAPIPREKPSLKQTDTAKLAKLASAYQHTVPASDPVGALLALNAQPANTQQPETTLPANGVTFTSVVVPSTAAKGDSLAVADAMSQLAIPAAPQKDQSRIVASARQPSPAALQIKPTSTDRAAAASAQNQAGKAQETTIHQASWNIQIGAFPTREGARDRLASAKTRKVAALKKATPFLMPVAKNGNTLYRARFSGLSRKQATRACRQLKRAGVGCFPLAPTS